METAKQEIKTFGDYIKSVTNPSGFFDSRFLNPDVIYHMVNARIISIDSECGELYRSYVRQRNEYSLSTSDESEDWLIANEYIKNNQTTPSASQRRRNRRNKLEQIS